MDLHLINQHQNMLSSRAILSMQDDVRPMFDHPKVGVVLQNHPLDVHQKRGLTII